MILMRVLPLLVVALCGTSCVLPPSCIHRVFGFPNAPPKAEHFATLTVYSEPIEGPIARAHPAGIRISDQFERGALITIDGRGSMAVSTLDLWPRSCPKLSQEDLVAVSHHWQPVLNQMVTPHAELQVMAKPYSGHPEGPLLSLQFGPVSGKNLGVLWDGQSTLPQDLDIAVMATLEMVCANSRLARRYLLRDLPRQVASRLRCR